MSESKSSLQDIIKKRRSSDFVGRDRELGWFRRNLNLTPDDPERKFIVSISGQGGMGKTYLLKRFRVLTEEFGSLTAWTDDLEKEIPTVLSKIAADLDAIGHPLKKFNERYKVYRAKKQEVEADPQVPQGFAGFLGRTIAKGTLSMAKRIPIGGAIAEMVDEKGFEDQIGEFATFVARKLTNKDEIQLVLEPVDVLTPIFLEDLFELAEKQSIVLFFDTFEATCDFLDPWLRNMLNGRYGNLPANFLLAIAGRNPLNENWMELNAIIEPFLLEPLSETDARAYLNQHQITDEATVSVILNLTNRIPLWLATLAAQSPEDPSKVGDPAGEAVTRYLCWVENDLQRQTVLDMAFPLSWNQDLVAFLVGDNKAPEIFSWLQKQPFVTKRNQAWEYHVVVRNQLLRYQQQQSPQHWTELHNKLADFFQQRKQRLGLDEKAGVEDAQWKELTLANLYHQLCSEPRNSIALSLDGFLKVLQLKQDFASNWSSTILRAGEDVQNIKLIQWGNNLQQGLNALDNEDYPQAIELLTKLIDEKVVSNGASAIAYARRGYIFYLTKFYEKALADFNRAIELDEKYAWAIARRGKNYRSMKLYNEATADFSRAIEQDEKYAWAIASRGKTYRLMGRYQEALADFTRAIELKDEIDWYFSGRGETYRLMKCYEEALSDFNRAIQLDKKYAWAFASRGQTYQALKYFDQALSDFNQAIELDNQVAWYLAGRGETYSLMQQYEMALVDFNRAIELNEKYAWAIARRGETYHLMGCYEEALSDFNQAIELDNQVAWYVAGRGETYSLMQQYEMALVDFNRAIELNEKYAWAIARRGETYRLMGCYEEALPDFNQAIELDNKVAWYVAGRGESYRLSKRYEEALTDFNRAIELNGKYAWAIASRGQTFQALERYDEALIDFTSAIELNEKIAWYIAIRGKTYRLMKRYEEALTDFNRAIELNGKYAWAIANRGQTFQALERYDESLIDFNRAIELDEKYAWAIARRGQIFQTLERYDEALTDFTRAIELEEKIAWYFAYRGETYRLMERYDESLTDFNRAIELDEKYSWAIAMRGITYLLIKCYDKSLVDLTRAINLEPDSEAFYLYRSIVYRQIKDKLSTQNDLKKSIEIIQSKYEINPKDWDNISHLALCYISDNQTEKALAYYQQMIEGGATIADIKSAINDFEKFIDYFPTIVEDQTALSYLKEELKKIQDT